MNISERFSVTLLDTEYGFLEKSGSPSPITGSQGSGDFRFRKLWIDYRADEHLGINMALLERKYRVFHWTTLQVRLLIVSNGVRHFWVFENVPSIPLGALYRANKYVPDKI